MIQDGHPFNYHFGSPYHVSLRRWWIPKANFERDLISMNIIFNGESKVKLQGRRKVQAKGKRILHSQVSIFVKYVMRDVAQFFFACTSV